MIDRQSLLTLTENCDIYFDDSLISKELIFRKYAEFFAESLSSSERSSSIALHSGSVCFDIVSFIMAALASITFDETDADETIASLKDGDMVLFKNERYRWCGVEIKDGKQFLVIEQDGRGKNGRSTYFLPDDTSKAFIKPYYGTSSVTDGRGIRKKESNRSDFISFVTGKSISEIPPVTGVSVVIVSDKALFDRIQKGLKIEYEKKRIGLLDIVPASYYTDGDEPYQFGRNPSKSEPVLKIAGKVSVARDLVLDKHGNKPVGFMVIGSESSAKSSTELESLLARKSLRFTHLSMNLDSENIEQYIGEKEQSSVFALTKEFLSHNSSPVVVSNPLTVELNTQITNIVNNEVKTTIIDGGCSREIFKRIKNELFIIRQSNWDEERKKDFMVPAYSLLNLFTTAVFSMGTLENSLLNGEFQLNVSSPSARINELRQMAEEADSMKSQCVFVTNALDDLYKSLLQSSPKYQALRELLENSIGQKVAIVIPKAYYSDILKKDSLFSSGRIHITTANRFDGQQSYDKIIVIGDFSGKRFDALKCKAAADIIVLLYECETHLFKRRKHRAIKFERKLNAVSKSGQNSEDFENDEFENDTGSADLFEDESLLLDEYIDTLSLFDVRKFAVGVAASGGNAPLSEVIAIGQFIDGERILFSKYYKAIVYNPTNAREPISETDVEKLTVGDRLLFAKRDDFTRNIVDSIFDALQASGKLSREVLTAYEKAQWWKKVLRDYQQRRNMSYRQLAKSLKEFECTIQEQGIRQWLVPDSHIVGPRDESTLRQIAKMTGDTYLLSDASGYFNACRIVRSQRKKILALIGKAIEDKLSGHQPQRGSELEAAYNNVDNLSEIRELEAISILDEVMSVPINLINRPIADLEV